MKQTAVTWLVNEIKKNYILNQDDFDLFEKAKEMEKQQIIDAWDKRNFYIESSDGIYRPKYDSAEQYYKETFKQNN